MDFKHPALAAPVTDWLDPKDHPPPIGRTIDLLMYTGIATHGHWCEGAIGWAPKRKVPPQLKEKIGRLPHP